MKKQLFLILALVFVFASLVTSVSAAANEYYEYKVAYTTAAPAIDGAITDDAWNQAPWAEITHAIENSPAWGDIPAKFKVLHDGKYLYFAVEVFDDTIAEWDSIGLMFSDVRAEDPRLGPNNTVSFRRCQSEFIVESGIGKNGNFDAPQREGDNLVSIVDWKMVMTTDNGGATTGYVVEAKLEYLLEFPERIYFNAQWGNDETDYTGDSAWNPYWGWNLLGISTTAYGELVFLAEGEAADTTEDSVTPEDSETPKETETPDDTDTSDSSSFEDTDSSSFEDTDGTDTTMSEGATTPADSTNTGDDQVADSRFPVVWIVAVAVAVAIIVTAIVMVKRKKA